MSEDNVPQWCRDAAEEICEGTNELAAEIIYRYYEGNALPKATDDAFSSYVEEKMSGALDSPTEPKQEASGVEIWKTTLHVTPMHRAESSVIGFSPDSQFVTAADHDAAIAAKDATIAELRAESQARRDALVQIGKERAAEWKRAEAAEATAQHEAGKVALACRLLGIRTPEPGIYEVSDDTGGSQYNDLAEAIEAAVRYLKRDAEELHALRASLREVLAHLGHNNCDHAATHRGGNIWTICDDCGRRWADDEGGFQPYTEPAWLVNARRLAR